MTPNYTAFVKDCLTPVVALFEFIFILLLITIVLFLWKRLQSYEKAFGENVCKWIENLNAHN